MNFNPDSIVYFAIGPLQINATIVFTWLIMAALSISSWSITRRLSSDEEISRWQNFLEVIVENIMTQTEQIGLRKTRRYLPFIGSLFLFIATASLLNIVPYYTAPTGSLSTTTALAICVLIAVPVFGIRADGFVKYLKHYIKPTFFMLPFNIIAELSRTIALAVRLYGNIMSGTVIATILLSLTPYFFPIVMQLLGLLTGMIQAYIFAILATVYISSAVQVYEKKSSDKNQFFQHD